MAYRVILVPVMGDAADPAALALTQTIAGRLRAHVVGLHVRSPISIAVTGGMFEGAYMTPDLLESLQEAGRTRAAAARDAFRRWQEAAGAEMSAAPGAAARLTAEWSDVEAPVSGEIGRQGRTADLVVLARSARGYTEGTDEALQGALFQSGRPVLLVPGPAPADPFSTVVIAWNDSRESAHAVAAAWSLIGRAKRIVIFAGGDETRRRSAGRLAVHLAWRGYVPATVVGEASTDIGSSLLALAARENAGLIVMGAYSHSRLRHLVLGGATSDVLQHATIPVLMAH